MNQLNSASYPNRKADEQHRLHYKVRQDDSYILHSVADTGSGMFAYCTAVRFSHWGKLQSDIGNRWLYSACVSLVCATISHNFRGYKAVFDVACLR